MVDGRFRRGVARGWFAFGDIAFGALVAIGGLSFGGIALGGVGIGLISFSGLAVAAYALGGLAVGVFAMGGLALGWHAAIGGGAFANQYAIGGAAFAEHANDAVAQQYMETSVMRYGLVLMNHARWFIVLAFLPAIVALSKRLRRR
jgi:hypothetical protein